MGILAFRAVGGVVAALVAAGGALVGAARADDRGDDPAFLALGAGYFDWNRQKEPAAEFRAEYRSDYKLWIFRPLVGLMATTDSAVYAYAGIGIDVFLGRRLVVTPSFAPGYYAKNSGYDLGYGLEFKSQIEFAYRFDDRSRLGLAISHISNASLGDKNPGTESAILYYSIPFDKLLGK